MLTLDDTEAEQAYRGEIRQWIAEHISQTLRWRTDYPSLLAVDRILADANLLAVGWPTEYGGQGLPSSLESILVEELGAAGVLRAKSPSHQGLNNLGPALMVHGGEQQKAEHLAAILRVENIWCQGFSEPDAGSDLASVRTRAEPGDGGYVITGRKIWTSNAENANWIYVLARTGTREERHRGLSFFLVPMESPGISHRPIVDLVGHSEFSEVTLDEVAVPEGNLLGEPGRGWAVAMTLLNSERLSGRHRYATIRRELGQVAQLFAADAAGEARPGLEGLGRLAARVHAVRCLSRRVESLHARGLDTGSLPSVNKLWWPVVHQELAEFGLHTARRTGADPAPYYELWLSSRAESIYGGTAQIQRNLIAERQLGLPR